MAMKDIYDEPIFFDVTNGDTENAMAQVESEIRELSLEQPFAVLATQGEGQPYTNLISFAVSEPSGSWFFLLLLKPGNTT